MIVADVGKLALLGVFVVGCFALVITNSAELLEVAPFLTLVVGYLTGNGVAAARKSAPSPVVVANVKAGELATIHGPLTEADTVPVEQGDDAWPEPEEHRFFTDDEGSL